MDTDRVRIVLVADPDLATEIAQALARELPERLQRTLRPGTDWQVEAVTAPLLADEQVHISGMVDTVLPLLPGEEEWDIAVFLTDLPRRAGLHPVSAEVSPADRVALVSLPALGLLRLETRAAQAVTDVVRLLVPEDVPRGGLPVIGRIRRDGSYASASAAQARAPGSRAVLDRYVVPGVRGRFRLFAGMVRANRPWRLFTTLSRALAGVFATAAYGKVNSSSWLLGTGLGPGRQLLCAALSVLALVAWIIVDHELWERPDDALPHGHARLYNLVTAVTIALGVLSLYGVVFVALAGVSLLMLDGSVLAQPLGHRPGWTEYLSLACFLTSAGMIGGAFGSGLEDDGTVRKAAYGKRQRDRRERIRQRAKDDATATG